MHWEVVVSAALALLPIFLPATIFGANELPQHTLITRINHFQAKSGQEAMTLLAAAPAGTYFRMLKDIR
jgi:hypothetical protein